MSSGEEQYDGVLLQVRRLVEGLPYARDFPLLVPGRTFRREGSLQIFDHENGVWTDVYCYCFSDLLLWGTPKSNSITSAQYTFECLLTLDSNDVLVGADVKLSGKQLKNAGKKVNAAECFEVRDESSSYRHLLRAVTVADCDAWVKALRKCITDSVRARKDREYELAQAAANAAKDKGKKSSAADDDDASGSSSSSSSAGANAALAKKKKRNNQFRRSRRVEKLADHDAMFRPLPALADDAAAGADVGGAGAAPTLHSLVDQNDAKGLKRLLRRRALGKATFSLLELDAAGHLALNKALARRMDDIVALLLAEGVLTPEELSGKDANNNTALHVAAAIDNAQAILALLSRDEKLVHERNAAGDTPLHVFCEHTANDDCLKIGIAMIYAGAGVETRNTVGETPLHKVALNDAKPFVQLQLTVMLLSHAAVPNDVSEQMRETPLHYAVRHRRKDMVLQLMQAGADLEIKSSENLTPIGLAMRLKHDDIKEAILHFTATVSMQELTTALATNGLLAVLKSPPLTKLLFMMREARLAGESVQFWSEADVYAQITHAPERVERATAIFNRYFDKASEQEIDIPKHVRRNMRDNLGAAPSTLFVAAQETLFAQLEQDLELEGVKVHRPPKVAAGATTPGKAVQVKAADVKAADAKAKSAASSSGKTRALSPPRQAPPPQAPPPEVTPPPPPLPSDEQQKELLLKASSGKTKKKKKSNIVAATPDEE